MEMKEHLQALHSPKNRALRNGKTCQANGLKEKQQKFGNNLSHIRNERGVYVETLLPNPEETVHFRASWAALVISNIALISQVFSSWDNLRGKISRYDTGFIRNRRLHVRSTFQF